MYSTSNFFVALMPFFIVLLFILARTFCALCEKRICNKNNSLLCISGSESFHKKCLKLTTKTFNKFHISKNFLCVDCAFKNLLFYESSDSSDYYSTDPKSDFPSNALLKFFNNFNSLEIINNNEEDILKINSKYFTIKEFLNLDLNDNSLSLCHVNIASLNKYLDDLHNFFSIIKLQIQVIGMCEHKIKKVFA